MKPPAFQFYPDDFLAGTVTMNHEERGLYILALCVQWSRGGLTQEEFDRLGSTVVQPSRNHVLSKFKPGGDGILRNERMETERQKQKAYRELQSAKGQASAKARFNHGSTTVQPSGQPDSQPKVNSPSPSPSPSPKDKEEGGKPDSAKPTEKAAPAWEPSPLQLRLGRLYKRRPTTRWTTDELKSFRSNIPTDLTDDDLSKLEKCYRALEKGAPDKDYRRRDLQTLLNNFAGELDRARNFKEPTCL